MKLKKIASLMLAGIMAVSMLAGCNGGNAIDDNKDDEKTNVATGIVGAVEGAIKLKNSKLVISVKENQVMSDALQKKVFDENTANAIKADADDSEVLGVLNAVFPVTDTNGGSKITASDNFTGSNYVSLDDAQKTAGKKYYAYTVITSDEHYGFDFNTYAANVIAEALADLGNSFRPSGDNSNAVDGSYTMYLCRVDDKDSSEKDVPFLVAVIEANYKDALN